MKKLLIIFGLFSINKSFSQQNTNIEAYTKKAIYVTNGRLTCISINEIKQVDQNEVHAFSIYFQWLNKAKRSKISETIEVVDML